MAPRLYPRNPLRFRDAVTAWLADRDWHRICFLWCGPLEEASACVGRQAWHGKESP